MSQSFLDLIRKGKAQEIAEWVKDDPQIAESRDAQGVSALLLAVYCLTSFLTLSLRLTALFLAIVLLPSRYA